MESIKTFTKVITNPSISKTAAVAYAIQKLTEAEAEMEQLKAKHEALLESINAAQEAEKPQDTETAAAAPKAKTPKAVGGKKK
jgi:hypothetical protein